MAGRLTLQNAPARQLFTAEHWAEITTQPNARVPDALWAGFSAEQKSAIVSLRAQLRADGFGDTGRPEDRNRIGGGDGGPHWAGRQDPIGALTIRAVIDAARTAAGSQRVQEPWEALPPNRMMVMSINVENLFREADDPTHADEEFIEAAGYTKEKFYRHLQNIGTVIKSVNGGRGPDILGLIEVEDKRALEKLVELELNGLGYQTIALEEGHDRRGIDVGLISRYPLWPGTRARLIFSEGNTDGQRGILRAELDVQGKKMVVYVNHWKSMRDGEGLSADENTRIATALKADLAATLTPPAGDPKTTISLIGDFNTKFYGGNRQAIETLGPGATSEGLRPGDLWDATHTIPQRRAAGVEHPLLPAGTHGFKGEFDFLDRVMVNGNGADGGGGLKLVPDALVVIPNAGRYFGPRGGGNTLAEGVSDHKALVAQFEIAPQASKPRLE